MMASTSNRTGASRATEWLEGFSSREASLREDFSEASEETEEAYQVLLDARREYARARGQMSQEHSEIRAERRRSQRIWRDYYDARDQARSTIRSLREASEAERRGAERCLQKAEKARRRGNSAEAQLCAERGIAHRKACEALERRIRELENELREDRRRAKSLAPRIDSGDLKEATGRRRETKRSNRTAKQAFRESRERREELRREIEST